ncbi:unnamed protein product [Chrysoparadoxa australica]
MVDEVRTTGSLSPPRERKKQAAAWRSGVILTDGSYESNRSGSMLRIGDNERKVGLQIPETPEMPEIRNASSPAGWDYDTTAAADALHQPTPQVLLSDSRGLRNGLNSLTVEAAVSPLQTLAETCSPPQRGPATTSPNSCSNMAVPKGPFFHSQRPNSAPAQRDPTRPQAQTQATSRCPYLTFVTEPK